MGTTVTLEAKRDGAANKPTSRNKKKKKKARKKRTLDYDDKTQGGNDTCFAKNRR